MRALCVAIVWLLLASTAHAQGRIQSVGQAALAERALVALNAFEAWAYLYSPIEAETAAGISCEPRSADAPHACYSGTIPPCIGCFRYVPLPYRDTNLVNRAKFLAAESLALATLDSAVRENPTDEMFVGTLVFLLSKRGRHVEAGHIVDGSNCQLRASACLLLRGYISQALGRSGVAAIAFDSAVAQLPEAERCELLDARAVMEQEDRLSYSGLSCAERASRDAVFWWLSDPSWLVPGNDRYVEHIARAVGNRILQKYRGVLLDIANVRWYAGLIPRTDSLTHFENYAAWVRHPAGEWRWWHELTRFGLLDAMHIDPGEKRNIPVRIDFPGGSFVDGGASDGCAHYVGQECMKTPGRLCSVGYEPREMPLIPRDSMGREGPGNVVPPRGTRFSDLYPRTVYWRYDYSPWNTHSCSRFYNTRARYQFTPAWGRTLDPFTLSANDLTVTGNDELSGSAPYREQYTPEYAPVSVNNQFQIARMPRRDSMLVLAVVEFSGDDLDVNQVASSGRQWESALLATQQVPARESDMLVVRARSNSFSRRHEFRGTMLRSSIVAGLELLMPDTVGFARTRVGIALSPWLEGNLKLSDLVLFKADTSIGGAASVVKLESILPSVLPSLSVPQGDPLGLYWEMEMPPEARDSQATVTLVLENLAERPGLFGRVIRGIFGGGNGHREVLWQMMIPRSVASATVPSGNAIRFPTRGLPRGEYRLSLRINTNRGLDATTVRRIAIIR